jgi:hypothetical protein
MLVGEFDFSFPIGAFGFSSGWRHTLSTTQARQRFNHGELFFRRPVYLHKAGVGRWRPYTTDTLHFDVLVKRSHAGSGSLSALSSGAGSAIVIRDGHSFRYKRCGSRDLGFLGACAEVFYRTEHDDVIEYQDPEPIGQLAIARARHELDMIDELHHRGLCPHCRPFGLVEALTAPDEVGGIRSGAAVFEITSDVRLDEFIMMTLTPVILEMLDGGFYRFQPEHFSFLPVRLPVAETLERWYPVFDIIRRIGNLVGRTYRELYDAGYYRGRGNAWLGNDIIGADGLVSIVDVDELMSSNGHSMERAALFHAIEINEYIGRINGLLSGNCSFPIVFGAASTFLTDGFRQGLDRRGQELSPGEIAKVISAFAKDLPNLRKSIRAQSPSGFLPELSPFSRLDEAAARPDPVMSDAD